MGGSGSGATQRRRLAGVVLTLLCGLAATACTPDGQAPPQQEVAGPVIVKLAVYGSPTVVKAYTRIAADFSATHRAVAVSVRGYPDHDTELAATRRAIRAGHGPSLFLTDRTDLDALLAGGLTMPVDELLGARHVDFGDGYTRNALEEYSENAALQCMPTQLSPLVVYYNTDLVDLTAIQGADGDPITAEDGWTFQQFERAARRASRHGAHGLAVAPTLEQVAPFVYSAGGDFVDHPEDPTALTLASGAGVQAIRHLRHLVGSPDVSPSAASLSKRSAVTQFEDGDLAMLLGFRDLTPQLRRQRGLSFDVLPFPMLRTRATVGEMQGVCLTRTESPTVTDAAADFLAYLVADGPAALLARTGAVLPTNLAVEASDAFLQPDLQPASAGVFASEVRRIHLLPTGPRWQRASAIVDDRLPSLLHDAVHGQLETRLQALDDEVTPVLALPTPSASPSASPDPSRSDG